MPRPGGPPCFVSFGGGPAGTPEKERRQVRYAVAVYRAPMGNGWAGGCFDLDVHVAGASREEVDRRLAERMWARWRELARANEPEPAPAARVAYRDPTRLRW